MEAICCATTAAEISVRFNSSTFTLSVSCGFFLEEDHLIRQRIKKRLVNAGLVDIGIERVGTATRVTIRSSRPGLIIGRGGKGIEELKNALLKDINTLRRKNSVTEDFTLNVNVEELKRTEISAAVVAQQIASIL